MDECRGNVGERRDSTTPLPECPLTVTTASTGNRHSPDLPTARKPAGGLTDRGELDQLFAVEAPSRTLRERGGSHRPVERLRIGVPVEHRPVQPSVPPLDAHGGERAQQGPTVALLR